MSNNDEYVAEIEANFLCLFTWTRSLPGQKTGCVGERLQTTAGTVV